MISVKFKKLHPNAIIPFYAINGDVGLDITAVDCYLSETENKLVCETGIAVEIPEGYGGFIFPRSSITKRNLVLSNSVGVIDSGYRGEIKFKFNYSKDSFFYEKGDRVGQLVILALPKVNVILADDLSVTDRDVGGFGSTGR